MYEKWGEQAKLQKNFIAQRFWQQAVEKGNERTKEKLLTVFNAAQNILLSGKKRKNGYRNTLGVMKKIPVDIPTTKWRTNKFSENSYLLSYVTN